VAATPATAKHICDDLTDEQWHVPLADGQWSTAQIVGHLFDVDIVYGFRWRLVLTEDKPTYPGYNEKLWSQLPRPRSAALLAAWSGIRSANVALLRATPQAGWKRWGTHGEQGDEQFRLMVDKIAGHDLAHLNQLARTVAVAREA
jgi:DinB superfamily